MKRIIYRYFSSTYFVKGNKIHAFGESIIFGINKDKLINDIIKVFGLSEHELKWYLKGWIRKQNKGFDFKRYWHLKDSWKFSFPIGTRVSPRLMAVDLVRVQPMGMPFGLINHLNIYIRPEAIPQYIDLDITPLFTARYEGRNDNQEEFERDVKRTATYYEKAPIVAEAQPSMTFSRPSGGW